MTSSGHRDRLKAQQSALDNLESSTIRHWHAPADKPPPTETGAECVVEMGWGRLIFAHTFASREEVTKCLCTQDPSKRDIAFYVSDPHVLVAEAPAELFLDPSYTFRLWLEAWAGNPPAGSGFSVRPVQSKDEARQVNTIYASCGMIQVPDDFLCDSEDRPELRHLVAVEEGTGHVVGTVTGVDHYEAFGDREQGSSLWCLAVAPQCSLPGVGRCLVESLAYGFRAAGRAYMDLSVMHDNPEAIGLYEKLGFDRIPVFCVKRKNAFNEPLFVQFHEGYDHLNSYARILVDEAVRRGIQVTILDPAEGYFRLSLGGRSVVCRESLTELTTAVAMSRCDNKRVTRKILDEAGVCVPAQEVADDPGAMAAFVARHKRVVVKPARGEQGRGIAVDLRTAEDVERAVLAAREECPEVLLESFCEGEDLRLIVIDHRLVAAAVRRPAMITGTGRHSIRDLIVKQSRRRMAATDGESHIPLDLETERCLAGAAYTFDDILAEGVRLTVRKTANLHTGGTIHDVTHELNPRLAEAAERASHALDIPVVGLDFMVPNLREANYVCIEANERPGLANHEPQPTAERFIDLLFPKTAAPDVSRGGA